MHNEKENNDSEGELGWEASMQQCRCSSLETHGVGHDEKGVDSNNSDGMCRKSEPFAQPFYTCGHAGAWLNRDRRKRTIKVKHGPGRIGIRGHLVAMLLEPESVSWASVISCESALVT